MDIIKSIEHEQLKNKIPELKVGNTVVSTRHTFVTSTVRT